MSPAADELLKVEGLRICFITRESTLKAVDDVTFSLGKGGTLGIVGESGSGKSITSLSLMKLVPRPGKVVKGSIFFDGLDLVALPEEKMRKMRGKALSMIFQDPLTALNPVLSIGDQIAENILMHEKVSRHEALERTSALLEMVRIPCGRKRLRDYPHQFSGGMRQRVMIAMALACSPRLLIADEPTTALDVTVQAEIMRLLGELRENFQMALLLITHNLGLVRQTCSSLAVMYAGTIQEQGETEALFSTPLHPYTQGLLNSIPRLRGEEKGRLVPIEGHPPSPAEQIGGCLFHPRCAFRIKGLCESESPPVVEAEQGHSVKCFLYRDRERKAK
ncbi:MAG: ABC transporter ATP-binding protein [Candidatus Eremiobacteraeota bacterium]|nr:ABC transporter ATP-binding protein [Candidatus Eremiobacteraeota bacterium]